MSVQRILASTYEQTIANAIASRDNTVDTTVGPVRDVIAYPVSVVCDQLNQDTVYLSQLLSLQNVPALQASPDYQSSDIDAIAYNDQILRGPGAYATSTVSLLSASPPTSDVDISVNYPFSTNPDPSTGATSFFRATQAVSYVAANSAAYYNANLGMYQLSVPVAAVAIGTAGNIGPNTIVKAQRPIGGFQQVTNLVGATGGTAAQSDQSLVNTLLIFALGINDISTPYGIQLETQRQFPQITSTAVVYGTNPLLTRAATDAGATDVYILGSTSQAQQDSFIYVGQPMVLSQQPGISVASVISGSTTYVQGTDYAFVPDTGPYGGSIEGQDSVQFLGTATQTLPALGATVTISYTFNALIGQLQTFFTSPQFMTIGRDLLYKQGFAVNVTVVGTLYVLPGFSPTTVQASVATVITNYIGTLVLGEALTEFNLLTAISNQLGAAGGVSNFVLTTLALTGNTGVGDIPAGANQYIVIQPANLQVNLAP